MINRNKYTGEVPVFQDLGTGYYYYNYDIREEGLNQDLQPEYSCICLRLKGTPNYKDCHDAVRDLFYTRDEELEIMNREIQHKPKDTSEYEDYVNTIAEINTKVSEDIENYKLCQQQ